MLTENETKDAIEATTGERVIEGYALAERRHFGQD